MPEAEVLVTLVVIYLNSVLSILNLPEAGHG